MMPIALETLRDPVELIGKLPAHLQVVILTSKLSGSFSSWAKSWKNWVMCDSSVSITSSKTVNRIKMPISRWAATGEVMAEWRKGNSLGHCCSGTSWEAIAAITRAVECRTS